MSAENFGQKAYKCQFQNVAGTGVATANIGTASAHTVLHGIVINSHTSGTFKLGNGTVTNYTAFGGTYTPATGSSILMLEPVDFDSGLCVVVGGTLNATVLYNSLP